MLFLLLFFAVAFSQNSFQVHVFNIGQADSQLIIFPSGFSILYDVGELSWNSKKNAVYIAEQVRTILKSSHVDVAVVSHLHVDHIGYPKYGGFWHLLYNENMTFGKLIDRDGGLWKNASLDPEAFCNVSEGSQDIDWQNAGTTGGTARNWICWATDPRNSEISSIRETAIPGSITQINPPDEKGEVMVVVADGSNVTLVDNVTSIQGDLTTMSYPPSENDYSIALKIRFGDIIYATAGDSDGEYAISASGYTYNDVEKVMGPIYGEVEIYRANHHGSSHSSSLNFMNILKPRVSLISCGSNSYGHPDQTVLDRLTNMSDVYITAAQCDITRDYSKVERMMNGTILLQSYDGEIYMVGEKVYKVSNKKPKQTRSKDDDDVWSYVGVFALALFLCMLVGVRFAINHYCLKQGAEEGALLPSQQQATFSDH